MATTTTDAAGSDPIQNWLSNGAGTEKARLTSAGKLGLGTTSPDEQINLTGNQHFTSSGSTVYSLPSSGFVTNLDLAAGSSSYAGNGASLRLQSTGSGADGTILFSTNQNGVGNAERMRITNVGNVGINASSPGALLDIQGGTSSDQLRMGSSTNYYKIGRNTSTGFLDFNGTQTGFIGYTFSGGEMGIGTTSPAARLHVKCDGSSEDQLRLENSHSGGRVWALNCGIDTATDLTFRDQTNSVTVGTIHNDTSGNGTRAFSVGAAGGSQSGVDCVGAGQGSGLFGSARDGNQIAIWLNHDTPSGQSFGELSVAFRNNADSGSFTGGYLVIRKISGQNKGTLALATYNGTSLAEAIFIDSSQNVGFGTNSPGHLIDTSGGAYCDGSTWHDVSSREYKKDIFPLDLEQAVEVLMALSPVRFTYKSTNQKHLGFIAEDVPDLVASTERKGLSPMNIVAILARVVQDQQKKIDELGKSIVPGIQNR